MGTFAKALNFLKGLIGSFGMLAPIIGAFGVVVPPAAIALAPVVITLMQKAEEALGDGTGPLKKAAVTDGVVAFATKMAEVSTGGQKDTWTAITPSVVSTTIDALAATANQISTSIGSGNPIFDSSVSDLATRTMAGGKDAA
jgi:hypothetical protein